MYGPIFSVLLMGMVPAWGLGAEQEIGPGPVFVAPPASEIAGDVPVLSFPGRLSASGILILDLDSAQTLYQRSAAVERPMASLTKLMTALLIVERHDLGDMVTIPAEASRVYGSSARLTPGDRATVGDLLSALLIHSANDAAVTLAVHDSGSQKEFVKRMNARAAELGLRQTTYVNPTGLDEEGQESSPRDIAWLTMFALRFPAVAERMATPKAEFTTQNGAVISLTHTHALLHAEGSPIVAGKTGTTDGAGQCLLSIVHHANRRYLVVLLSSEDRYADMRRILRVLVPDFEAP
jgi:serine-type D-Ala-D-Ala carboxypeptidase (penicillin-binding protein 5/6)